MRDLRFSRRYYEDLSLLAYYAVAKFLDCYSLKMEAARFSDASVATCRRGITSQKTRMSLNEYGSIILPETGRLLTSGLGCNTGYCCSPVIHFAVPLLEG
jgi:hypothetical protein